MAGKLTCVQCDESFIGRSGAKFCSPACKQKAHRARSNGNAKPVTVTVTATPPDPAPAEHSSEAQRVLAALDEEMSENSAARGEAIEWSAAEQIIRGLIADATDRRVELRRSWAACEDDKIRVKISAELRLLESNIERLLRHISTDDSEVRPTISSRKASHAARARWSRPHERVQR